MMLRNRAKLSDAEKHSINDSKAFWEVSIKLEIQFLRKVFYWPLESFRMNRRWSSNFLEHFDGNWKAIQFVGTHSKLDWELDDYCLTRRQLLGVARGALEGQHSNKFFYDIKGISADNKALVRTVTALLGVYFRENSEKSISVVIQYLADFMNKQKRGGTEKKMFLEIVDDGWGWLAPGC